MPRTARFPVFSFIFLIILALAILLSGRPAALAAYARTATPPGIIAYTSSHDNYALYVMNADGTNARRAQVSARFIW